MEESGPHALALPSSPARQLPARINRVNVNRKALHLAQGREVWGHVTARLLGELPDPPPRELIERARVLDNYYIPARYPNGHDEGPAFEHYGSLHSSQAVEYARKVLDYVRMGLADT